jgi:hypothetical protein
MESKLVSYGNSYTNPYPDSSAPKALRMADKGFANSIRSDDAGYESISKGMD